MNHAIIVQAWRRRSSCEWIARLAPRPGEHASALDVAMGRGRHAVALAIAGFRVVRRRRAIRRGTRRDATGERCRRIASRLVRRPDRAPAAASRFDVIVVTRYLQRDLFPALSRSSPSRRGRAVRDVHDGAARAGHGPTSPDHLLEPGELRQAFDGFEVLFYEEVTAPEAVPVATDRSRVAPELKREWTPERSALESCDGSDLADRCRSRGKRHRTRGSDTLRRPGPCDSSP